MSESKISRTYDKKYLASSTPFGIDIINEYCSITLLIEDSTTGR